MSTQLRMHCVALLLGMMSLPADAGTAIDETRAVTADARISVDNLKGSIKVSTWDRNEVHIGGQLGDGVEKLDISGGGSSLTIKVEYPESGWFGGGHSEPSDLQIQVPRSAALDLESVSARIDVNGIDSASIELEMVSGNMRVAGRAAKASANSVSGDIELDLESAALSIETVSGDINAKGKINGALDAESVSGDLELAAADLDDGDLSSVSGDIQLRAGLKAAGRLNVETVSGDVRLRVPSTLSADISAETFSGGIHSSIGTVQKQGFGSGASLQGRLGDGDARVEIETFSGAIRIETE